MLPKIVGYANNGSNKFVMKTRLVFLFLVFSFGLSAQYTPPQLSPKECVLVAGQSNADYAFNYGGPINDSIPGGSVLSVRLKTIWATDTVPYVVFGRGATYLYDVPGVSNWNTLDGAGFFDSTLLIYNGVLTYPTLSYSTGTNSAISHYRFFRNEALNPRVFIWLQGENDSQNLTYSNAYQANLTAFIAGIRSQFQNPDLPFIMVQLGAAYTGTNKAIINTAYANIVASIPNTGLISTSDFTGGTYYIPPSPYVHYNVKGAQLIANRIADLIDAENW